MEIFHCNVVSLRSILILFGGIYLIACSDEPEQLFQLPSNASQLVAGDSLKTWKIARRYNNGTRMNMAGCSFEHRQIFLRNKSFHTASDGLTECGDSMIGKWAFVKDTEGASYIKFMSDQIPEMMNIEEKFKLFRIMELSDTLMILRFNHAQTTKRQTTLVDYFVPEDYIVNDRSFHW